MAGNSRTASPEPFDQQDQNNEDDPGEVITEIDDDPPEWFIEDPDAHPLADSYRVFGYITLDTFYASLHTRATAESLMQRPIDGELLRCRDIPSVRSISHLGCCLRHLNESVRLSPLVGCC